MFPTGEILQEQKPLKYTRHIREELDLRREITGQPRKRKNKYETVLPMGKFEWILSYARYEECIILIHLGKKRR